MAAGAEGLRASLTLLQEASKSYLPWNRLPNPFRLSIQSLHPSAPHLSCKVPTNYGPTVTFSLVHSPVSPGRMTLRGLGGGQG